MEEKYKLNLMPYQWDAFNGDTFVQKEFLRLKEIFSIKTAVELGTCLGSTAIWMARNFDNVITIEINPEFAGIANERFVHYGVDNIKLKIGDTVAELPNAIHEIGDNSIWMIDSHWYDVCPMLQELKIIANRGIKPVIVIHDFKVPDEPNLGFDSIHGQAFEFEWIKPSLDAIYGEGNYDYYYNSDATSTEIKRGVIYITPSK